MDSIDLLTDSYMDSYSKRQLFQTIQDNMNEIQDLEDQIKSIQKFIVNKRILSAREMLRLEEILGVGSE